MFFYLFHHFMIILTLLTITIAQTEVNQCLSKLDCLSCSIISFCYWKNNNCIYSDIKSELAWYYKLSSCLYNNYDLKLNSEKYCVPLKPKQIPFNAKLSEDILTNNVPQVFCQWTLNQFSTTKQYKFEYKNKNYQSNHFAIIVTSTSGLDEQTLKDKYSKTIINLQKFKVFYYGEQIDQMNFNSSSFVLKENKSFPYFFVLIIVIGIFTSLLCGLCIALWKNRYSKTRAESEIKQSNEREGIIDKLLKQILYKTVKSSNMTICMICLEHFTDEAFVCQFECKHIYHYACIRKWIEKDIQSASCPNCKKLLFENYLHLIQTNEEDIYIEQLPSLTNREENNNVANRNRLNTQFRRIHTLELIPNQRNNNYINSNNIHSTINYNYNSNLNLNRNSEPNTNSQRYYTGNNRIVEIRQHRRHA